MSKESGECLCHPNKEDPRYKRGRLDTLKNQKVFGVPYGTIKEEIDKVSKRLLFTFDNCKNMSCDVCKNYLNATFETLKIKIKELLGEEI